MTLLCGLVWLWAFVPAAATEKNGFDLSSATIPPQRILRGGPPRDGIPAIDNPIFIDAAAADFLADDDWVLGITVGGIARAYPIKILNWHEVVNDRLQGKPLAVTFCPLCGSGVVFDATVNGRPLTFGVSGLLYNSDVLLYDRQTDSLWSQLLRRSVSGTHAGIKLATLPVQHTTWKNWRLQYPATQVLSTETGEARDYAIDPYAGYEKSPATIFPVQPQAPLDSFHPKEWVLGVHAGDKSVAYPFSQLRKNGRAQFADSVGGKPVVIHWNETAQAARAEWPEGGGEAVRAFWFAWFAFNPQTRVFRAE